MLRRRLLLYISDPHLLKYTAQKSINVNQHTAPFYRLWNGNISLPPIKNENNNTYTVLVYYIKVAQ